MDEDEAAIDRLLSELGIELPEPDDDALPPQRDDWENWE